MQQKLPLTLDQNPLLLAHGPSVWLPIDAEVRLLLFIEILREYLLAQIFSSEEYLLQAVLAWIPRHGELIDSLALFAASSSVFSSAGYHDDGHRLARRLSVPLQTLLVWPDHLLFEHHRILSLLGARIWLRHLADGAELAILLHFSLCMIPLVYTVT